MYSQRRRKKAVPTTIAGLVAVLIGLAITQWKKHSTPTPAPTPPRINSPSTRAPEVPAAQRSRGSTIGWTSKASLQSHYQKHGSEFGDISIDEYLRKAQALRDTPKGGPVLEIVRGDGVITRFNRLSGDFIAFNPDQTIRTYFHPAEGERYFRRQAEHAREDD